MTNSRPPRWAPRPNPEAPERSSDPGAEERLQKILAQAGVASRRAAEELIAAGRVTVNGKTVTEMGTRANPARDVIAVDGRPIKAKGAVGPVQRLVYIALHKPSGVVSTAKDPHGRPTVLSLIEAAKLAEQGLRVYPVGRLDADSTGLLLLTNDGDLTFRLTHPRFGVEKEYRVLVRGRIGEDQLQRLRDGVEIEDGVTAPAKVDVTSTREGNTWLRVTIREGRKRQVRLMTAAVGHQVIELQRVRFGPIDLGTLEPGKWRNLAVHEVHALRKAVRLKPEEGASIAKVAHSTPEPAPRTQARGASRPRTSTGPGSGPRESRGPRSAAPSTLRQHAPAPRPQMQPPGQRPQPSVPVPRSRPAFTKGRPPMSGPTGSRAGKPTARRRPPFAAPRAPFRTPGSQAAPSGDTVRTNRVSATRGTGPTPSRTRPSGFGSSLPRRPGRPSSKPPGGGSGRPSRPPLHRGNRPTGRQEGPGRTPAVKRFSSSKRREDQ